MFMLIHSKFIDEQIRVADELQLRAEQTESFVSSVGSDVLEVDKV